MAEQLGNASEDIFVLVLGPATIAVLIGVFVWWLKSRSSKPPQ